MTHIKSEQALTKIKAMGLATIRCSLTGAPIANYSDQTVTETLDYYVDSIENVSVDRLVDEWQGTTYAAQFRPCPMMQRTLATAGFERFTRLAESDEGCVRLLSYFITRSLTINTKFEVFESAIERNLFIAMTYDVVTRMDPVDVKEMVIRFSMIESHTNIQGFLTHAKYARRGVTFRELLAESTEENLIDNANALIEWLASEMPNLERVAERLKATPHAGPVAIAVSRELVEMGEAEREARVRKNIQRLTEKTQLGGGTVISRKVSYDKMLRGLAKSASTSQSAAGKKQRGRKPKNRVTTNAAGMKMMQNLLAGFKVEGIK